MEDAAARLKEAFGLALSDLYEANAAAQICYNFDRKIVQLADEPAELHRVWHFIEQAVSWKLALALERLTQVAKNDRASLMGLLREIEAAQKKGIQLSNEQLIAGAIEELETALDSEITKSLKRARDGFIGHSLIGASREGVRVRELVDYIAKLESIAEKLYEGSFDARPDFDAHIDNWRDWAFDWFERVLPRRVA